MITEETVRKQLDVLHQEGAGLVATFGKKKDKEAEPFEVGYSAGIAAPCR